MSSTVFERFFALRPTRRRVVQAVIRGLCLAGLSDSAAPDSYAQDWMFRRSYYSHERQPGDELFYSQPVHRSAYRRAYVSDSPGFAVRGGWRYNTNILRSGSSVDVTVLREGWFEFTP